MKDLSDAASGAPDTPRPPRPPPADPAALAELEALFLSAAPAPSGGPPLVIEQLLKTWSRSQLEAALRRYEVRLGTADEQPHDLDLILAVAHRLNNLVLTERLRRM